ncbi:MAG TPA: hypothetical protein DD670_08215 [Planctomycetaceae bacterium]|nr:hypothetical protein [Planctomycetaceae bacterium]
MNKSRWSSWMKSLSRFVGVGQNKSWRGKCPLLRTRNPQLEPLEQRQMLTILYWDPIPGGGVGGDGTWSTDSMLLNWNTNSDGSGSRVAWIEGADAVFAGSAGTVAISGTVSANSIQFNATAYSVESGMLSLPVANTEILIQSGVTATISSTIDGTGGMAKTGTGVLNLTGSSANTYGGSTSISAGSLWLEKASGAAAIPGDIHFNGTLNAYVYLGASEQIADLAVLYFNNTSNYGRFWLHGHTETVAGINTSNGRGVIQNVQSESGADDDGTLIVNNTVDCFYAGYLRDKGSGDSTGTVSLVKQGTGELTLSGENIYYTGGTNVSQGTLVLQDTTNSTFLTKNIAVNRTPEVNATLEFATVNASPIFNGQLSGNGTVVKSGSRYLAFGGNNSSFTGEIHVNTGRLRDVSGPTNFGSPSMIRVNDGGQIYAYNAAMYDFPFRLQPS